MILLFFFFKQKTAYEMRISDWSSDVCSSDLPIGITYHEGFRRVTMLHLSFPNESTEYRTARNALLDAEIALRRQLNTVATQRRPLPPDIAVPPAFVFERIDANPRPDKVNLPDISGNLPFQLLNDHHTPTAPKH